MSDKKLPNQPFLLGCGIHTKVDYHINPDAPHQNNPHIMIIGSSGSGKTRELKELVKHFVNGNKFVFVLDFHGDVSLPGETVFRFTARNSPYGINLFEFDKDPETGGVIRHCKRMISMFRRFAFGSQIGPLQAATLQRLFIDVFAMKGILDQNEETWEKPAPSIEDLQLLMQRILDLPTMSDYATSDSITNYHEFCKKALDQALSPETPDDVIALTIKEFEQHLHATRVGSISYKSPFVVESLIIDSEFYLDKEIYKRVKALKTYVDSVVDSKAFSANDPVLKGLSFVRFDLSGLDVESISVMSDILIGRIFRAKKNRGEYRHYEDKSRGAKVDTYIVVDEGRMILPTGADKENPYNHLNMIAAQSRKFGLGMILVSQRISHFPGELLGNIEQKIILQVEDNDIRSTGQSIGLTSAQDQKIFQGLQTKGICLARSHSKWNLIALPWSEKYQNLRNSQHGDYEKYEKSVNKKLDLY